MQPQVSIISGDMCGRNGLKSKVSTSEELYDFFSEKILKNYIVRCDFWSCRHFVDRLIANYFNASSIALSSSCVKSRLFSELTFSIIWEAFDAPRRTLVSLPPLKFHAQAIWASDWPLFSAILLSLTIFSILSAVMPSLVRNGELFAALESAGIPFMYLFVRSPCASGHYSR